jgi:hypothetical protein
MDHAAVLADVPATTWPSLLTWGGLVVLVLVSVVRGWLVPKASHEREISILEKRIEEKTAEAIEWRAAYQTEQAVGRERDAQHRMLLETGKTTAYAVDAIRTGLERDVNPA